MKSATTALTALLAAAAYPAVLRASPLGAAAAANPPRAVSTDTAVVTITAIATAAATAAASQGESPGTAAPTSVAFAFAARDDVPVEGATMGSNGEIVPYDSSSPPRPRA
ncbi:hypothetical protein F5X98DRAFT_381818 [Xylaria grammica]|nr:hypothetical protein F5X98DRAFT_381818 [Xylaria grammica]